LPPEDGPWPAVLGMPVDAVNVELILGADVKPSFSCMVSFGRGSEGTPIGFAVTRERSGLRKSLTIGTNQTVHKNSNTVADKSTVHDASCWGMVIGSELSRFVTLAAAPCPSERPRTAIASDAASLEDRDLLPATA